MMKVMILCGGRGTRLREHTETKPKPMVEVGGRPILWHIMKGYAHHGVRDFILCLGYKGAMIKEYFLNYQAMNADFTVTVGRPGQIAYHGQSHDEDGWRVTLADTGENAMTGARVQRAAHHLDDDETFLVTYGDGVADIDFGKLIAFHNDHGGLATLTGVRPPSRFGEFEHDRGRVKTFHEKPQVSQGLINGGFFVFQRAFLDRLDDDDGCVLERQPLTSCAAEGELHVYEHSAFWQCMDTYRDWEHLDRLWREGRAAWKTWA